MVAANLAQLQLQAAAAAGAASRACPLTYAGAVYSAHYALRMADLHIVGTVAYGAGLAHMRGLLTMKVYVRRPSAPDVLPVSWKPTESVRLRSAALPPVDGGTIYFEQAITCFDQAEVVVQGETIHLTVRR